MSRSNACGRVIMESELHGKTRWARWERALSERSRRGGDKRAVLRCILVARQTFCSFSWQASRPDQAFSCRPVVHFVLWPPHCELPHPIHHGRPCKAACSLARSSKADHTKLILGDKYFVPMQVGIGDTKKRIEKLRPTYSHDDSCLTA